MTDPSARDPEPSSSADERSRARREFDAIFAGRMNAPGEAAGDLIGRYKLLEQIGAGGMGTVWLAQQSEPLKRKVALKIIKLGMDTREVVARFEVERQALALMDHPHIARVLDGGATETGRPFFVMELVRGTPITDYCDRARLGLRARLRLFIQVCEAIQHAHHKGIIHRDIKSSNVLVTLRDDVAVPKVIDFGIAKATSSELTQKTLFTRHAQVIGTPEYMAPEQASRSGLDIDTRADVYSLGVLLYVLLTGTKPFDIHMALEGGYDELLRTIREIDPSKPSARVAALGKLGASLAEHRGLKFDALAKQLRGDLDWIVMKALEKDRARRYETANSLAADIGRYLSQEPVLAAPPSAAYRVQKFVRRRKKSVAAVALFGLLFAAGSTGTGIGLWRTVRANEDLDLALDANLEALQREKQQRERAELNEQRALEAEAGARAEAARASAAESEAARRASELDQVATFQADQLRALDPERMGARLRRALLTAASEETRGALETGLAGLNFTDLSLQVLEENLFAQALRSIDAKFGDQPLVRAQLLYAMETTLVELGLVGAALAPTQQALALRRKHLGEEHPDTLRSVGEMGRVLLKLGRPAEAEVYFQEALLKTRRFLGEDHALTLQAFSNMGVLLEERSTPAAAEPYYREALERARRILGNEDPITLDAVNDMGLVLMEQDRLSESELYCREAVEGNRRVRGEDDPDTLISVNNLAIVLARQGKPSEAEPYYREAIASLRRTRGDAHPYTLSLLGNLGTLLYEQGKLDEAEPFLREAAEGGRARGHGDLDSLTLLDNLAALLVTRGELRAAEPFYREVYVQRRLALGGGHWDTRETAHNLIDLIKMLIDEERAAHDRVRLGAHLGDLGALLLLGGDPNSAELALAEAADVLMESYAEDDWRLATVLGDLGAAVAAQGRRAEAESLLLGCAEALLAAGDLPADELWWGSELLPLALRRVVELYEAWHVAEPSAGHDEQAASWRAELDRWNAKRQP